MLWDFYTMSLNLYVMVWEIKIESPIVLHAMACYASRFEQKTHQHTKEFQTFWSEIIEKPKLFYNLHIYYLKKK